MTERAAEMNRLADIATHILYDEGEFIHAMPYRAGSYNDERMPLMHEIVPKASTCEATDRQISRKVSRVPRESARLARRSPLARRSRPRGVSCRSTRGASLLSAARRKLNELGVETQSRVCHIASNRTFSTLRKMG